MTRIALLFLALLATGCGPYFEAATTPPPGRRAALDSKIRAIEISTGVAMAFTCTKGGPCRSARAVSDDPTIAEVHEAHLNQLGADAFRGNLPASTFVVVGKHPGKTVLRVTSKDGDKTLSVTVVP